MTLPRLRDLRRGLLIMLLVVGAAAAGGRTHISLTPAQAAAAAQDPPLPAEDEAWVVDAAVAICNAANDSGNEDESCDGPVPLQAALRDCLQFTFRENLDRDQARAACRNYIRNSFFFGPRTSFDAGEVEAGVTSTVAAEAMLLSSLGIDQAAIDSVAAALRQCVVRRQLGARSFQTLHDECRAAFRPAEESWIEASTQTFSNSLTPLLDQGYSANDLLRASEVFRSCLSDSLGSASLTSASSDDRTRCEFQARTEVGLGRRTEGAPAVGGVACTPSPVAAGGSVSCSATISGSVTGWQWSAPGGNPNALDGAPAGGVSMGETVSFATSYQTSGDKTIELTACNRVAATAELPERNLCAVGSAAVTVSAVAPTIDALSCSTGPVATGDVVSCTATVGGSTGTTSQRWSAPGGDPSDGRGSSFSTQFTRANTYTITFRACNGADPLDGTGGDPRACAEQSRTVEVRGGAPVITSLGCPATAPVNDPVTCTATITGMVTSRTWTAPGGTPPEGTAMSFSTRFASAGSKTIFLQACNGMACATSQQVVNITGMTRCTQWDISGMWQTAQGNGYNPSFDFQQNGTSITGFATLPGGEATRAGFSSSTGSVSGTLRGDQLDVTVTWSRTNGPVTGRYTATVVQGRLSGSAGGPSWNGSGPTRCVMMV
jgi:hypothetical protein